MTTKKLKVAFIGSGLIGIDLLIKAARSKNLECVLVAGRNYNSKGMKLAKKWVLQFLIVELMQF